MTTPDSRDRADAMKRTIAEIRRTWLDALEAEAAVVEGDGDGVWHRGLITKVRRLGYDFERRVGRLDLPADYCTDMSGAITLFTRIDPKVREVRTFAGDALDTVYVRDGAAWTAHLPEGFEPERPGARP